MMKLQETVPGTTTKAVDLAFCFTPMDENKRIQAAKLRTENTWLWLGDGIYTANSPFLHSEKLNLSGSNALVGGGAAPR